MSRIYQRAIASCTQALLAYSETLSFLSVPVSKINDHQWVYDNIEEYNPFNKEMTDYCRTALRYILENED
jgi:hypothetical protein